MMYNGYNPYQYMGYNSTQPLQQRQEVIRVNGRNGADAYQMAPNSSILLLDETAPIIWLKTTDGASYPTVTGYTITPIETRTTPVATTDTNYSELENRIARLEELVNDRKSDAKPVKTITKQQ